MTNLEDRIIAYLDGTLDESSRAELLHMLSVSPEKRKLLEEHIKLREIISLGHKPQPVPLMTERKLADRIPVLMQELPYLAEKSTRLAPIAGLRGASYVSVVSRYVSGFLTSRFAPAFGLGTLVLAGGLTWYLASSSHDADVASVVKPPVHQERMRDGYAGTLRGEGTTNTVAPSIGNPIASHDQSSRVEASLVRGSGTNTPSQSGEISRNSDRDLSSHDDQGTLVNRDEANSLNRERSSQNVENKVTTPPTSESSVNANATNTDVANVPPANTPAVNVPSADIKNPETDPTPLPLPSVKEDATGRWYAQSGVTTDMNFRPNQQEQVYQAGAGKTALMFGGGYELNPHIAVGLEVGWSQLSQQFEEMTSTSVGTSNGKLADVSRTEYNTDIVDVDAMWTQATFRYTLNPGDQYRIETSAGAGAAYVDGLAPMVSVGIGGTYALSEDFDLTMGATLRGAWLSEMGTSSMGEPLDTFEGPVAVVSNRASSSTVFTSAVSGRIGIRFGF